jgi:hypothetical protein
MIPEIRLRFLAVCDNSVMIFEENLRFLDFFVGV